jgi:hypothetical protein
MAESRIPHRCVWCGTQTGDFDVSHIVPQALQVNLVLPIGAICTRCNRQFDTGANEWVAPACAVPHPETAK